MDVPRRTVLAEIGSAALLVPTAAAALTPTQPLTMGPFYPLTKPTDHDHDLTRVHGHGGRAQGRVIESADEC
jgi:hypothetical protein